MSVSHETRHDELERLLAELDRRYLTTRRGEVEAAAVEELTGVSLRTLRHWRSIGAGPPSSRTVGTIALYALADVLEWLTTQRRASGDREQHHRGHE